VKIKFIKPSFTVEMPMNGLDMLKHIEKAGRTCYKSEDKITDDSAEQFVKMIVKRGHDSVLEHCSFSVRFICDRGVSHELVRHRLASFSQESTRYVGYGDEIVFIIPSWCDIKPFEHKGWCIYKEGENGPMWELDLISDQLVNDTPECIWAYNMADTARAYGELLNKGWRPEQARSVLPNSLKTEIVVTANLREWRHIFKLRDSMAAHPDMRAIMTPLHDKMSGMIPGVFE
jgi:thymidylate synthase (FAD)